MYLFQKCHFQLIMFEGAKIGKEVGKVPGFGFKVQSLSFKEWGIIQVMEFTLNFLLKVILHCEIL